MGAKLPQPAPAGPKPPASPAPPPKSFTTPDFGIEPGEDNNAFCRRFALMTSAEDLMRLIVSRADSKDRKGKNPAWLLISDLTGHGSGISMAIAERYRSR